MSAEETDTFRGNVKGPPCWTGEAMAGSIGQGSQASSVHSSGSVSTEGPYLPAQQNNHFISVLGPVLACWLRVCVVEL